MNIAKLAFGPIAVLAAIAALVLLALATYAFWAAVSAANLGAPLIIAIFVGAVVWGVYKARD